jgi:1,4-dihydroxy-2-naphthoate octaprenyltransferase
MTGDVHADGLPGAGQDPPARGAASPTRRRIWIDLLVYPTHSLPTAAAPVVIATAIAFRHHAAAWLTAVLCLLASWLVHIAGLFHDYYLLLARYPDNSEHPELVQAWREGRLTASGLRAAIIGSLALAALTGPYLMWVAGWPAVVFGAVGVAASLSYAGGPLAYARLGLAEIVFLLMFGLVAEVGAYYAQAAATLGDWRRAAATLPPEIWTMGLPVGALTVNILMIDDLRDRVPDAAKGWRTGAVRFGPGWARVGCIVLACLAYAAPFWFWQAYQLSAWILLPLATLPIAVSIVRTLYTKTRLEDLAPMTARSALLAFLYSALLAVGIVVSPLRAHIP